MSKQKSGKSAGGTAGTLKGQPQRILFCVPAYGGSVRSETMVTVSHGIALLKDAGYEVRLMSMDLAEISRVRNIFASIAMEENYDILMMVDADMSFPSDVFTAMAGSRHDVCGLMYPKRNLDVQAFYAAASAGRSLQDAVTAGLDFILGDNFVLTDGQLKVDRGFLEMVAVPAGGMMIRVSALRRLWEGMPDIRQTEGIDPYERSLGIKNYIRCFDNIMKDGRGFSEDISFCIRWRELGGKVNGLVDVMVAHHGQMRYEGRYLDSLLARAATVQANLTDPILSNANLTR